MKEDKDSGSGGVPGPYAYAGENSAQDCGIEFHGISQGKKQSDDLRKVPGAEI